MRKPAGTTALPAMSQVNARIGSELKRTGDEALARAGLTPTQAVRALWELATAYADTPTKLLDALFPDRVVAEERARQEELARKLALVEAGPKIMEDAFRKMGIAMPTACIYGTSSNEELREIAYREQYGDTYPELFS